MTQTPEYNETEAIAVIKAVISQKPRGGKLYQCSRCHGHYAGAKYGFREEKLGLLLFCPSCWSKVQDILMEECYAD